MKQRNIELKQRTRRKLKDMRKDENLQYTSIKKSTSNTSEKSSQKNYIIFTLQFRHTSQLSKHGVRYKSNEPFDTILCAPNIKPEKVSVFLPCKISARWVQIVCLCNFFCARIFVVLLIISLVSPYMKHK